MVEIAPPKLFEVLTYPNPILKTVSEVVEVTQEIKDLVQNLFITMYKSDGVGLSAIQVGISKRVFVMDTSNSGQKRYAFINPQITSFSEEFVRWREGCLSFPNIFAFVRRSPHITIKALNEKGEVFELDLQGVDAVCFQHEMDHLDGITFYDHLSPLQKNMIKKKIKNLKK